MKDANNIRNRWRRYRAARFAYGFAATPFRTWARTASRDSYAAKPGQPNERVGLFACRCAGQFFCTCYRERATCNA